MKNIILTSVLIIALSCISSASIQAQPSQEWIRVFGNSEFSLPYKMIFDKGENLLVTGISNPLMQSTFRYSKVGKLISEKNNILPIPADYSLHGITTDNSENTFILINYENYYGSNFIGLWKFNPDLSWNNAAYFSGDNGQATGKAFAQDLNGNIFIAGNYINRNGESVVCILKYSNQCQLLWQKVCSDVSFKNNTAVSVKTDNDGFIYIAGINNYGDASAEFFVKKFSESGKIHWTSKINGTSDDDGQHSSDEITNMIIDKNGNVYLTGIVRGNKGVNTITLKINSEGKQEWIKEFDFTEIYAELTGDLETVIDDFPNDIESDNNDNIYITGYSRVNEESYIITQKIGSSGNNLWVNYYKSPDYPESENVPSDLFVDKDGNSFITGYQKGLNLTADYNPGKDIVTLKYSPDGAELWRVTNGGDGDIGSNDDIGKSVLAGENSEVYVLGQISKFPESVAYCIVKYNDLTAAATVQSKTESKFKLNNNFPNPFNPSTTISFEIPEASNVTLKVFDITGKEVASLLNGFINSGYHEYSWNASQLSSGVYFYRIQAGSFTKTKKMHLIK